METKPPAGVTPDKEQDAGNKSSVICFGDFELDVSSFELRQGGRSLHVEPLVFDLIHVLARNAGRILTRDELIDQVWGGRIVSDATVSACIKSARKALGDTGSAQQLIRTVRGRGFQFIGQVGPEDDATTKAPHQPGGVTDQLVVDSSAAADGEPQARPPGSSGTQPSIAVLPLHVLTPDSAYAALGDAVSQEVILELSRLHWLFVTARGSSFQFRGPSGNLQDIADVLGVRYLMTGTIAFVERSCVVALELSQAADGQILWTERFRLDLEDLLQLKIEIAGQVVRAVETRIQATEAIRATRLSTESLDAWSAYHRGLWHMFRFNQKDNEAAHQFFSRAIALDPAFARAHAGLSFTHFQNAFLGYSVDRSGNQALAARSADKGVELDPLDPFALLTKGRAEWLAGKPEDALPWLERSIALSPNYAFAIYNSGVLNVLLGNSVQSREQAAKAIELSPIDPLSYAMLATRAMSCLLEDDYASAATWAEQATRAPNAHVHISVIGAICHDLNGDPSTAKKCIDRARRMKSDLNRMDFFAAFPFNEVLMEKAEGALDRLGL